MEMIEKACKIAVERQKMFFGEGAVETRIKKLRETDDVYVFDFHNRHNAVLIGGGGVLIYKSDFSVLDFCLPSYPPNIFDIMDNAVDVEIPEQYR